jgi:hypothetical protein
LGFYVDPAVGFVMAALVTLAGLWVNLRRGTTEDSIEGPRVYAGSFGDLFSPSSTYRPTQEESFPAEA